MLGFGHREVQDRFAMKALGRRYRFVPPRFGRLIPTLLQRLLPWYMRGKFGIDPWEVRGVERLRDSIEAGHGVVLTPNHSRDSDSVGIGFVGIPARTHLHIMAGWHVLLESRFQQFVIPRSGGFSVQREGSDKSAVRMAIDLVARASRPVVVFPEGFVTRMNDRLGKFQEGASLVARQAAGLRDKQNGSRVVIHPVVIKYQFNGDFAATTTAKLSRLEDKLNLEKAASLLDRLERVREAIVADREKAVSDKPTDSPLSARVPTLINSLLRPLEETWDRPSDSADVYERVRRLRSVILDRAAGTDLIGEENRRLRRQLEDCTWALKLSSYQPEYLAEAPSVERFMETLDSLEEDVFGGIKTDHPWRMVLDIGEAIPVTPRDKSLGQQIRAAMETQLAALASELNQPLPKPRSPLRIPPRDSPA